PPLTTARRARRAKGAAPRAILRRSVRDARYTRGPELMIGKLTGNVVADEPPLITLDVQGVGYEVAVPVGTVGRAGRADGAVELWVHTVLRSDALELFGFSSEHERRVFRQLIGVPNVGPRTALAVLSALPVAELVRAVSAGDVPRLTKVP